MATVKTLIPQKETEVKRIRVAAYCRVSTDSADQKDSFDAQVEYYTRFIGENPNWTLADIYADQGISGTSIDLLKARGIPIIFEKEGLNTMQATSEKYLSLHGIFAQSESESLSGNVRMGKEMSAKKGIVTFSYKNFLGYRRGADNQPEIDPEEAEIVRMIFDRYLAGDSLTVIKGLLENRGVLSPTGKATWSVTTIRSILTNEKYKGDALLQKTYVIDCITHKSKKNDDRPQYYVENNHPAIVSKEVFDRVQEEMARRTSKRKVKEVGTKPNPANTQGNTP